MRPATRPEKPLSRRQIVTLRQSAERAVRWLGSRRSHPAIPSVQVAPPRVVGTCRNCGESIVAGERTGEYEGTTMHQACALERQLADAVAELAEVRTLAENARAAASYLGA